ncbi:MAG: pilus assembly protein PilM [Lachnospiraceae bacterium]|nr:pilus assembly protein PilM [Lachnospiraceae bacterium]
MAKSILGIDIGYNSLKLALVNGKQIRHTAVVNMPENLIKEGRVVSKETMGELLRDTIKKNNIHCTLGAVALANESVFVRNVTMPVMTIGQLASNLPFEFRDYITDELNNYVYDYAVISSTVDVAKLKEEKKKKKKNKKKKGEEKEAEAERTNDDDFEDLQTEGTQGTDTMSDMGESMELLAAACQRSLIDDYREILHKAGLKLIRVAPTVSCYQSLIRAIPTTEENANREYCILDLGYQSIRMYMFRGDRHIVTRVLEVGLRSLDEAVAENNNIDIHLAHTNFIKNFEGCQRDEYCMTAYGNITVELMRALNFYRFSNPESHLEDIWICGGGAMVAPLQESIRETMDLHIHPARELVPGRTRLEDDFTLLQAIGATMD